VLKSPTTTTENNQIAVMNQSVNQRRGELFAFDPLIDFTKTILDVLSQMV